MAISVKNRMNTGTSGYSGVSTSGYSGYSSASGYSGYSGVSTSGYSGYSGTVGAGAITLSNMANLAANSIIGNNTGSITTPLALSITQANTLLLARPCGTTSVAMTGATTTLTVSSTRQQIFTGSGATVQTVILPNATTLPFVDWEYEIDNASTGSGLITINMNGDGVLTTIKPGECAIVNALTISTAAGTWDVDIITRNLPVTQQVAKTWNIWGHSYTMNAIGTYDANGRFDNILKNILGAEAVNWYNRSVDGTRITADASIGQGYGGWPLIAQMTQYRGTITTAKVRPYVAASAGHMICLGINDLGNYGPSVQHRTAFIQAMRFCISRFRASTVRDNSDASISYGAGMTALTGQSLLSTTGTLQNATTTTNANFTITIPADYMGEKIAICLIGRPGVVGGTVTWSGTAGLTGTLSCSNIMAAADNVNVPVIVRYTAPVTGSTQTIIGTVSQIDGSGNVSFDSWWLESLSPNPVIVCNLNRLTALGSSYYTVWAGISTTEALRDADVVQWNADLTSLVAEFDTMVQIADCDSLVPKLSAYFCPLAPAELHYNEVGGALAAQAVLEAINRLQKPTGSYGIINCLAGNAFTSSALKQVIRVGHYYFTQGARVSASVYSCVSGDMFATPFQITQTATKFSTINIECTNTPTTGTTIALAIFQDDVFSGQPGTLIRVHSTGLAVGTSSGLKTASITSAGELEPGLYWLVFKCTAAPSTVPTLRQIDGPTSLMPSLATTGLPISGVLGPVGWYLSGQGTGAIGYRWPTGATLVASAPLVSMLTASPGS